MKTNFLPCHFSNYQRNRVAKIDYIVIHYTGNNGDTALSNCRYFQQPNRGASAHYFVDSNGVWQSVKDLDVAWHCGTKGTYKHPKCRNINSIGIELCDDINDWRIYPSEKTIQNALDLTYYIMQKYNIPKDHVIRHYDVTGKQCPAYWVDDKKWKKEFWDRIGEDMVESADMIVNGKAIKVNRILKDGTNYVKLRDIANALNLDITNKGSTPILSSKKS